MIMGYPGVQLGIFFKKLVGEAGFEPATFGFGGHALSFSHSF